MKHIAFALTLICCLTQAGYGQTFESSFGQDGIAKLDFGETNGTYYAIHERSDGKLIVVGSTAFRSPSLSPFFNFLINGNIWVGCYDTLGLPDSSFAQAGQLIINHDASRRTAFEIQEDQKNRLWIGGKSDTSIILCRIDYDGKMDTSFGQNGSFTFEVPSNYGEAYLNTFYIDSLNHTFVQGSFQGNKSIFIAKVSPQGTMDSTFANNGILLIHEDTYDFFNQGQRIFGVDLKVMNNNTLLVLGFVAHSGYRGFMTKTDLNGNIDRTYGDQGVLSLYHLGFGSMSGLEITGKDEMVIFGSQGNNRPLAKLDLQGKLVTSFGSGGFITLPPEFSQISPPINPNGLWKSPQNGFILNFAGNGQYLARYDDQGNAIDSFGYHGFSQISIDGQRLYLADLAPGNKHKFHALYNSNYIATILPDGKRDYSNYTFGYFRIQPQGAGSGIYCLKEGPDQKLWMSGEAGDLPTNNISYRGFLASTDLDKPLNVIEQTDNNLFKESIIKDFTFLPEGKRLVCGTHIDTGFVAMVMSDGSLDSTFGNHGFAELPTAFNNETKSNFEKIEVLEDGGILVAGEWDRQAVVLRFLPSGILATGFGKGGYALVTHQNGKARSMQILGNGEIQVVGKFIDLFFIARLLPNGEFARSLNGWGFTLTKVGFYPSISAEKAWIDADSMVWVVGTAGNGFIRLRYTYDGELKRGVNDHNIRLTSFPDADAQVMDAQQLPDGSVMVVGSAKNHISQEYDFAMAKYLPSGDPDSSFGDAGRLVLDLGAQDIAYQVEVMSDSSLIVGGVTGSQSVIVKLLYELQMPQIPIVDTPNTTFLVYPNPIQKEAYLSYSLDQNQGIRIRLASLDGKHLATLLAASRQAGHHRELLRFPDGLSPGMYLIILDTLNGQQAIKILIRP